MEANIQVVELVRNRPLTEGIPEIIVVQNTLAITKAAREIIDRFMSFRTIPVRIHITTHKVVRPIKLLLKHEVRPLLLENLGPVTLPIMVS